MHPDQKIGLSLAVLVIGFAGAFCFRSDPISAPEPLALEQASAIDQRIEQLPIRAYTQREGVRGIPSDLNPFESAADLVDVSEVEQPIEDIGGNDMSGGDLIGLFPSAPEPMPLDSIVTEGGNDESTARQVVDHGTSAKRDRAPPEIQDSGSDRLVEVVRSSDLPEEAVDLPEYIVKSGDTLSGVSLKVFGTTRRYLEIYRANRDVLQDPDDLPVGTKLKIPSSHIVTVADPAG